MSHDAFTHPHCILCMYRYSFCTCPPKSIPTIRTKGTKRPLTSHALSSVSAGRRTRPSISPERVSRPQNDIDDGCVVSSGCCSLTAPFEKPPAAPCGSSHPRILQAGGDVGPVAWFLVFGFYPKGSFFVVVFAPSVLVLFRAGPLVVFGLPHPTRVYNCKSRRLSRVKAADIAT